MRDATKFGRFPFIALVLLVSGCASAKLEIESAIYKGEPYSAIALDFSGLSSIQAAIEGIRDATPEIRNARLALAEKAAAILVSQQRIVEATLIEPEMLTQSTLADTDMELAEIERNYISKFKIALDSNMRGIERAADRASNTLISYMSLLAEGIPTETEARANAMEASNELRRTTRILRKKFLAFHRSLGTVLERDFAFVEEFGPSIDAFVSKHVRPDQQSAVFTELIETHMLSLAAYQNEMERLQREGIAVVRGAADREARGGDAQPGEGFAERVRKATAELSNVRIETDPNITGEIAISLLSVRLDLLNSQIDRLQDPADPVWREVTDPANDHKWSARPTTTSFYAEGDTSVVVVRDRLGQFRVHHGKNDPSALVQGQLRISRVVASSAIDVLAATSGVPGLAGVLPKTGTTAADFDPSKAAGILEDDSVIRAEEFLRQTARGNLRRNLVEIRDELSDLDPALPEFAKEMSRLMTQMRATLNAHRAIFASIGG